MFQRTKICSGLLLAFGGSMLSIAPGAFAQDSSVQRVEITGSSIKRIDAETSVPVTVIKADDLKKQGVTTVEQILSNISAAQVQIGTAQVVGSGSGGAAFADIRGIGANKTLVLLNGRRIANNAFDSSAPDLNMIPFAAIERVEVLRDGASALYGTDAIGGVINFITRKDYRGGTITLGLDSPQHAGGASHSANIGMGIGDLQKDGINVLAFIDFNKTARIASTQRDFFKRTLVGPSATTFPGTYTAKTDQPVLDDNGVAIPGQFQSITYTPFGAPDCLGSNHLYPRSPTQCGEVTSDFVNYTPATERVSGLLKASVKLTENHTLGLEAFYSHNRTDSIIAPVPYGGLTIGEDSPYYPGNGITPVPEGVTLLPDQGPIGVRYRDVVNGYRQDIATNQQSRFVASLEGNVFDWDYNVAAALNTNTVADFLNHGYTNGDIITEGVFDGTINPFGAQTPAGAALLASAVKQGVLQHATGQVQSLDGHASRDLPDFFHAGRPAAIAVGFEARHERFLQAANTAYAQQVIASTGIDPNTFNAGYRDVYAGFSELNVPILKSLDVTAAVRYDKYSDFGSTTNPKFAFRFQPMKEILVRGSWSKGFRAPSLYELNGAPVFTNSGGGQNDPVNCPGGTQTPAQQAAHPFACDNQFMVLQGGNTELKPERAKNTTLGLVLEPVRDLTAEFDWWKITQTGTIAGLTDNTVFGDYSKFQQFYHYNQIPGSDGSPDLSTDGSQCATPYPNVAPSCGYVDLRNQNLGGVRTDGVDVVLSYRMNAGAYGRFNAGLQSTWVHKYEYQNEEGGEWIKNVGIYSGSGPIFRWQHNAELNWTLEPFSIGLAGHYKTGYLDQSEETDDAGNVTHSRVSAYATFDLFGTYAMAKGFGVTLGVKNLFDREPPYSNTGDFFQGGYDPRFADPVGRTYYARATYSF